MIASLHGTVQSLQEGALVVALGGLGLRVLVPRGVLDAARLGATIDLYTHLHVRENELSLYGFGTQAEMDLFLMLLGVNGVGPKMALAVISTFSPETLRGAVSRGDIAALTRIPGIGRRTAERLVLDLRDRVGTPPGDRWELPAARQGDLDVISALTALGYSLNEARDALATIPEGAEALDERILAALRSLGGS
ncbi:MAG: Holliday junction branch migration protein RuvA [Anaerolineae bacterium]|jgi:Holliday junction DNA helicase RuvA|nr:Holliday junction branch migration protein RuvA [Chloroflexota bacterium]